MHKIGKMYILRSGGGGYLLFSGYYHILTGRGDGFRLMGSKEIFQRQSWVVQKSTMPKT